jgi:hypothetical protein
MDKVHAPTLINSTCWWWHTAMQKQVFLAPPAHSDLQALQAIEAMHPFNINLPTFALQQHMDSFIPEPWAGISNLSNPHA